MKKPILGIILVIMLISTVSFAKVMYLNDYSDRNFVDLNKIKCNRKSNNIIALTNSVKDLSCAKVNFVKLAKDLNYVNILVKNQNEKSQEILDFAKIVNSIIKAETRNNSIAKNDNIKKNNNIFKNFSTSISGSKVGLTVYDLGGFLKFDVGYDLKNGMNLGNGQSVDTRPVIPGTITTSTNTITSPGSGNTTNASYVSY